MLMGRMPGPARHSSPLPDRRLATSVWGALLAGLLCSACQKDDLLKPGSIEINVMTATYLSNADFEENPIELNGEAKEQEWGGPLDTDLPYFQIRVTREEGAGDPGEPSYVSAKAVYTDSDIYFLFQWADPEPDDRKDAVYYIGPDLTLDPTIGCDERLLRNEAWTREFFGRPNDEDRLAIAFEIEPAGDALGTFAEQGCQVACHLEREPSFGTPDYGRLDVWEWLASRTNVARNLYSPVENANFPPRGIPGYLEDYSADPVGGLLPDPGTPTWRSNRVPGHNYPLYVYRLEDDPFFEPNNPSDCFNQFGERCRSNNGLPPYYVWRDELVDLKNIALFGECDTLNMAVLPTGQEPREWRPGDAVSGYWYTYPTGSRADVHGKGQHDEILQRWTLEVGRPLNTRDPAHDIIFRSEPGLEVSFSISISDNAGEVHWGSGPQVLRFGPKPGALRETSASLEVGG